MSGCGDCKSCDDTKPKPEGYATCCRNFHKYKALKPPTCNCDMCAMIWRVAQLNSRLDTLEARGLFPLDEA